MAADSETPDDTNEAKPPRTQVDFFLRAGEKVKAKFPDVPGVYLFQDQAGRVLYIGKAKSLRSRVGSYFLKAAAEDQRTADWCARLRRRFHRVRKRGRRPVGGSSTDQGYSAEIQSRTQGRQELSLPADYYSRGLSSRSNSLATPEQSA